VIVRYFNVVRVPVTPSKANAPLIVDPNAVLASSISLELLESVPRWHPQVLQSLGSVQYQKLPQGASLNPAWQVANALSLE
jgi:hypothetical protein